MKGERFKISKPFWEDCKDFEKDFIRNSVLNNGVSVSGTKFIINKARNINPNYTEISKNAIIEDEKGNRVQITYSTEYGVRPYYVEEEGLRTKEFFTEKQPYEMSFEEWQKKEFWSGERHKVVIERKGDNFILSVLSKENRVLSKSLIERKNIEIEKVDITYLNRNVEYFMEILYNREKRNHHLNALRALRFGEPTTPKSDIFRLVPTENGYKAVRGLGSVSEREQEFENLVELFKGENEDNYPLAEAMAENYADLFKSKYNLDIEHLSSFKHLFKSTTVFPYVSVVELLSLTKKEFSDKVAKIKNSLAKDYTEFSNLNLYNYFNYKYSYPKYIRYYGGELDRKEYYQTTKCYEIYDEVFSELAFANKKFTSTKEIFNLFTLYYSISNNYDAKKALYNVLIRDDIYFVGLGKKIRALKTRILNYLDKNPIGLPLTEKPFKFNINKIFGEIITKTNILDIDAENGLYVIMRDVEENIIDAIKIDKIIAKKHLGFEVMTMAQYQAALAQEKEFEKETTTYTSLMQVVLAKSLNNVGKIAPNAKEVKSFQKHITENYEEYQR